VDGVKTGTTDAAGECLVASATSGGHRVIAVVLGSEDRFGDARALLDYLVQRRIPSLVATHYPELKSYAHTTPGVTNASMEFDLKTLRPTYHLMIGLPGRSNALLIAERLGLPAEILQAARSEIHPDDLRSIRSWMRSIASATSPTSPAPKRIKPARMPSACGLNWR